MTTATTDIRELAKGYRWTVNYGREPFYDENDDRVLGVPDHSVSGFAVSEERAQQAIDEELEDESAS